MRQIAIYGSLALVAVALFFALRHQQRRQIARHIVMLGAPEVSLREEAEARLLGMGRAPVPQLIALIRSVEPSDDSTTMGSAQSSTLSRAGRDPGESRDTERRAARAHAARTLGRIGDRRAVPALVTLATSPKSRARRSGYDLLYQGKLTVTHDSPPGAAITALGQLGDDRGVPALAETADDTRPYLRALTAEALGRIGTAKAGTVLLRMLDDPYEDVAFAAVVSLIGMGETRALPALPSLLGSRHDSVRDAAARALVALGGEGGIMAGVNWMGLPEADAVYSATLALTSAGGLKARSELALLAKGLGDGDRSRRIRAALKSGYRYPPWADLRPGRRPPRVDVDLLSSGDFTADDCDG